MVGKPMLISEHQAIKRGGKLLGHVRYREPADHSYGFWQVKRLDSQVWEGEHETLIEAEGYLTGVAR